MHNTAATKQRGRPPAFNREDAMEKAMHLFWEHGYEGTSMAALMAAMNMNKPSIYAAFGNKEALFFKALNQYLAGPSAFVNQALLEPTSFKVVKMLLTNAVALLANQDKPRGCMIVQSALSCGPEAKQIQQTLISYRQQFENALKQRFDTAKANQDLPPDANTTALAKHVAMIHQGISVQATSGTSQQDLMAIVEITLNNWPTHH